MTRLGEFQFGSDDPDVTPLSQTAEKRKKAGVQSKIVNLFAPKPAEVDAKYKHGKHSIKDNTPIVTERNWRGKLQQKLTGNEDLRPPEYGRILPAAVDWWFNHATDLMNFWPDGPGEHHPFYDQWQMARSFVHKDGRVNKSLVMRAFAEDHDFYEKTMFFKRYNAIMIKNGLGLEKVINQRHGRIHKGKQPPLGDEILVPEVAHGGGTRMEKVIPSVLEAEASVVAALATISAALTVAGSSLTLPPAFLTTITALATGALVPTAGLAAAGGMAMVGGVGAYLVGKDAIHRIIRAAKERNDLDKLAEVSGQALTVVQKDEGTCAFLFKKFGINPKETEVTTGGKLHFKEGSTSTGWVDAQETLNQEEWFREQYLKDLVRLDHRALNQFHRRFGKTHLYEDQFLTEGGKLVISQSGSAYERDWATRFEEMRQARNAGGSLDMVPANREALQMLYMEAGKSICIEIANDRFSTKVLPDILRQDTARIMRSAKLEVKKKVTALKKGETPDTDGHDRVTLKKEAMAAHDRAVDLKKGVDPKDGEPAKAGLVQAKDKIRGTKEKPGILDRKANIDATYTECQNELIKINALYKVGVEIRDLKNIRSIERAIIAIGQAIEKVGEEDVGKKGELIFDLEEKLRAEVDFHLHKRDDIDKDTTSYTGSQGQTRRIEAYSKEDDRFVKIEAAITSSIAKAKEERQKLDTILRALQEKKQTLEKEYAKLEYSTLERANVAGLAELMKQSYTKLKTVIPQSRLITYGTPGNLMSDFMSSIVTAGGIWIPPQDEQYENQLTVLYAVAEARAKVGHKELHKKPTGVNAELLSKTAGKLSPEQLIIMSPHEVYDRVHTLMTIPPPWTAPPTYNATHIQEISQAIVVESARYEAREKALQSVMETQDLVITRMQKEVDTVDDTCNARIEQLVLLESVIQDRAVIYCEAPNMVRTENLRAYADGTLVQASSNVHSTMETGHPLGFVKFMQDVFAYHTFADSGRDGKGTPRNELELLKKDSRDELFDSLLRSVGAPPELMLANMIVEGYGEADFQSLLEGGILAKDLTFDQVMSVIAYRHDSTFPRPMIGTVPIALVSTADYPVKPLEMKKMLEAIVVQLSKKAMAGKI